MKASILVLDERRDDRRLMRVLLEQSGYRVLDAAGGEEALRKVAEERPSVVITDLVMPGMNGYQFVRRLRGLEVGSETPVIFCTGSYMEDEVRRIANSCGVRHFLTNPIDPADIERTIEQALAEAVQRPDQSTVAIDQLKFDAEHLTVLNAKLTEKVIALEALSLERQRLVEQVLSAHEEERERIAADLHDDALQALAAIKMRLSSLGGRLTGEDEQRALNSMGEAVGDSIARLRDVLAGLQPVDLGRRSLADAIADRLERIEREDGVVSKLAYQVRTKPEPTTTVLLYRSALELLMNVRKHAGARRVEVNLAETDEHYSVTIADDGRGFSVSEAMRIRPGHIGLPSVQARLALMGGTLSIASDPGRGTTVTITIPKRTKDGGTAPQHLFSPNGLDPRSHR